MFDFIVTHYDNLPDVTIFCRGSFLEPKGRPYPISNGNCSEENFLKVANNEVFTEIHDYGPEVHNGSSSKLAEDGFGFLEYNNSWYFGPHPGKYFFNLNDFFNDVYVNPPIPEWIRFSPGGNYIIPKNLILRYSKNFYEKIRFILSWGIDEDGNHIRIGEAHMIERALYTIFTCDWEVSEKYK